MNTHEGRAAVVTGASAGIGRAVALALAKDGASVVVNARRAELLDGLVREIGAARAAAVPGDAADDAVVKRMLDTARERCGRDADLVVVNAGRGLRGSVYDSDPARWEDVIRVNLLSASRLLRAAAERLAGPVEVVKGPPKPPVPSRPPEDWLRRPRDIVVLGSTVGRHVSPFSSFYGAAKAGVHMLTESLRRLIGPWGVRVTLVERGIVASEFQDAAGYDRESFGRFMDSIAPVLTPEDIARVVLFVTGQPSHVHVNDIMVRPTRQEYP
jgi:NADP-dependent 3-hydroxy acid dehydrogenase YdfG